MKELFFTVLELSFKASFLILAVIVLRLALKKAPRRIICALWLLVGLRLILPFSVESRVSLVPSASALPDNAQSIIIEQEQQITPQPQINITMPQTAYTPSTETDLLLPPAETLPQTEPEPLAPAVPAPSLEQRAAAVWLVGLIVMLGYLLVSYLLLRLRLREAVPAGDGVWQSERVSSPFVLGLLRPRIYLSFATSDEHRDYVLAHERSHIARRDHWTKLFGFLILSLHWFNPFVWLAYVLLCRDIELACDERVIRSMDAAQRKAYSLALLLCAVKSSPLAACPLAFGELGVKQRIKSVLHYKKPTLWIVLAALLCVAAAGILFLTDPKTKVEPEPPAATETPAPSTEPTPHTGGLKVGDRGNVSEFPLTDIYPDSPVGIGADLCYDDENIIVFRIEHGLFGYDLKQRRMTFAMDTIKAVGIAGYQGSGPGSFVRVSPDASTVQLCHSDHKEICLYIDFYSGDYYVDEYKEFVDEDTYWSGNVNEGYISSLGVTVGNFNQQCYKLTLPLTSEIYWLFEDFPFATTASPALPVEGHIMDKLRFCLPAGYSTGTYDLTLSSTGGGVAIYDGNGELCGGMELSYAIRPEISGGKIVSADDGENHASFISPFQSIDHDLLCSIAEHSDDGGGHHWYIIFAQEDAPFSYVMKLSADRFSYALAVEMAKAVRVSPGAFGGAFDNNDMGERVYWPIIDAYASAIATGLDSPAFGELGLSPMAARATEEFGASALEALGYRVLDMDGDGTQELMISALCTPDSFYYGILFELYTLNEDHQVVKVLESAERIRYYSSGGRNVYFEGSSGAADSSQLLYEYNGGQLISLGEVEPGGTGRVISPGLHPFSRIIYKTVESVRAEALPIVEAGSFSGCSVYTDSTDYTLVPYAEPYILRAAAIVNSGELTAIDLESYMLIYDSSPLCLLFDSHDASSSMSFCEAADNVAICLETAHGGYYYTLSGQWLEEARRLIADAGEFSINGTDFYYYVPGLGQQVYDITVRSESINAIISAVSAGEKIVVEGHSGPKNSVYCIFDRISHSFEKDIAGCNLTWLGDMLSTAVYSFWEGVYSYDGQLIKSYELAEDEYISALAFSDDGASLTVTITNGSGESRQDIIQGAIPQPVYSEIPGILNMHLIPGYSLGSFDGRTAAIYSSEGEECGLVELCGKGECELTFTNGRLTDVTKFYELSFMPGGGKEISSAVPGQMYGIAYNGVTSDIDYRYVFYATETGNDVYGLRLHCDHFSEAEARFVAESVDIIALN